MEQNQDPDIVYLGTFRPADLIDDDDFRPPPVRQSLSLIEVPIVGCLGDNNIYDGVYLMITPPAASHDEPRRRFPARAGNVSTLSPDPSKTVCASYHLNSLDMNLSEFRGQQSTSVALAAVFTNSTLPVHTWTTEDMDRILRYGDVLHQKLVTYPKRKYVYRNRPQYVLREVQSGYRRIYMMPQPGKDVDWTNGEGPSYGHCIFKSERYVGKVRQTTTKPSSRNVSIETAMTKILEQGYENILISVDGRTGVIMKDEHGNLRYFDPHCSNKVGRRTQVGSAVLLSFETTQDFIRHMRRRQSGPSSKFEMFGVKVQTQGRVGPRKRKRMDD